MPTAGCYDDDDDDDDDVDVDISIQFAIQFKSIDRLFLLIDHHSSGRFRPSNRIVRPCFLIHFSFHRRRTQTNN